ncbi:synaptonemal complex protein 1-like isoform X2 [Malania oleifera]|uniref:synaptonemal complex protein 1-like isoform X2 n=1 Tax=Malania oleifera TaxID=397392 RepID=UPI0025AE6CAD|nr:synaptonemal complex protein 1-like isoform X2 [Malania oleifera]
MQKLGLLGARSLDQFKSIPGSISRNAQTLGMTSRSSSESLTMGSFANLKITAEKLVKEQASVKTDLEMANSKLKKSMEHIRTLEEKLQNAFNENARLKVKQKEDEKLWKGLESKFSSMKTLCDQLMETLQQLAGQVQEAEKDKAFFEEKLSESSKDLENLHNQMNGLSLKIDSAEETTRNREKELMELRTKKGEMEKFYRDEQCRTTNLLEEKDAEIKHFEETVAANRLVTESLNSELRELQLELRSKDNDFQHLSISHKNLEKEKSDLQANNDDFAQKLVTALQDIKKLEDLVHVLVTNLIQLDKQSMSFTDMVVQLKTVYESWVKLLQQERDLATKHAQQQYDELHDKFLHSISENDALQLVNKELNSRINELQKVQEFVMVRHAEECHLAEERNRRLESEVEILVSKKTEMELLVSQLEEKNKSLSESSKLSESKMQELLLKFSTLESDNKDCMEKLQAEIHKRTEETDILQKEIGKHEQHVDSLENQISQLHNTLDEKEKLIHLQEHEEKQLEYQKAEIQALLAAAESKLAEDKKQYDLMLENKQLELSRHLKEISQRNDQAINDIRKKYEVEKLEIVNLEKDKADKVIREMERKCEQKLAECREESNQCLISIKEEHAALVSHIQQEHDRKESSLKAVHSEELRRIHLQAENELREKTMSLRNDHEVQVRALKMQHGDECRKLQEELHIQKSKEERQRALLQLQWKVMSDKPQEDQEVNSEKDYSISSIKMRNSDNGRKSQRALLRTENEEDPPFLRASQTPVSNLLKKVEKVNTGSVMSIPKHSRKVTHREYEVETANGKTITKRRKTKSTVMYGDPRKRKNMDNPRSRNVKGIKGGDPSQPSNIGDLFTEGSLNPYADDPYAFD